MLEFDALKINWIGADGSATNLEASLRQKIHARLRELEQQPELPILLVAQDPVYFLSCFFAAWFCQRPIFIANPAWKRQEWLRVSSVVPPGLLWSEHPLELKNFHGVNTTIPGQILIPTGGSSGQIRFAIHTPSTVQAAIQSFQIASGLTTIHSLSGLPLHHVSGLMPILRSVLTGGTVTLLQAWRGVANLNISTVQGRVLSLVPTQLHQLLESPSAVQVLQACQLILVGGSPSWSTLLSQARSGQLPLSPCYGMTETLGLIAWIAPENFLGGESVAYEPLPNVTITILNPDTTGIGQLQIQTPALNHGYYPVLFPHPRLLTHDLGTLNRSGQLEIKGRQPRMIITGGENVLAEEVEAAIRNTGLVRDVHVLGVVDPVWGQVVKAIYAPTGSGVTTALIEQALLGQLSRYKHPKQWQAVEELPRTPQGKLIYGTFRNLDSGTS